MVKRATLTAELGELKKRAALLDKTAEILSTEPQHVPKVVARFKAELQQMTEEIKSSKA